MATKKDVFYFRHDANARSDPRMLELRATHGAEGYGVYWMLVEMMRESTDSQLDYPVRPGTAFGLNLSLVHLQSIVELCITVGLFETTDGVFYSRRLKRQMVEMQEKSSKAKESVQKRYDRITNVDRSNNDESSTVLLKDKTRQDKRIEDKRREDDDNAREEIPSVVVSLNSVSLDNGQLMVIDRYLVMMAETGQITTTPKKFREWLIETGTKAPSEIDGWAKKTDSYFREKKSIDDRTSEKRRLNNQINQEKLDDLLKHPEMSEAYAMFKALPKDERAQIRKTMSSRHGIAIEDYHDSLILPTLQAFLEEWTQLV